MFIAILIFTEYHRLPQQQNYWSLDEDVKCIFVTKCMTRNRFMELKCFIHLANNAEIAGTKNRMYKIRPLMTMLSTNLCQWGIIYQDLSIDDSMIKYFENYEAKQFIRGKPIRFEFKNWMMSSSTGYCYTFDVYCGRSENKTANSLPLGSKVVLDLIEKIENPALHVLYFDNFFSSHSLLQILKDKNFRATGTVRENRTNKCPMTSCK